MPAKRKEEAEDTAPPRRSARTASGSAPTPAKAEPKKKSAPTKANKKAKTADVKDEPAKEEEKEEPAEVSKSSTKLSVGDQIPDVKLDDNSSTSVSLAEVAKEHGIVLFSYPAASTPGCTTQGCSYRDHYEEITKKGYKVYGISTDTVAAQDKFKTKQGFQCMTCQ